MGEEEGIGIEQSESPRSGQDARARERRETERGTDGVLGEGWRWERRDD